MIELVSRMEVLMDAPDITKDLLSNAWDSKNRIIFDFMTECEIDNSIENMTDTATVILPRKLQYKKNGKTYTDIIGGSDPLLKRGMKVQLFAGYISRDSNGEVNSITKLFQGYISNINPHAPLRIDIQDGMYLLKQHFITNYSKKDVTLKQVIQDILPPGTPYEVSLDAKLGWIRITRSTTAYVLDHLEDQYGVTINFDLNGKLTAGLRYISENPLDLNINQFKFEDNIIDDSDLTYQRADDQLIQLKAISIDGKTDGKPGSTRIEVTVGNDSGDRRTMYFYGADLPTLTKLANDNLKKMKYEGFSGSFDTFLQPTVTAGDGVKLINAKFPEKNGIYLVNRVVTKYGIDGGRQTIFLDRKVA